MASSDSITPGAGIPAAVGFDPATRSWVTTPDVGMAGGDVDAVPPLDGTLHVDETTRREYSRDAGRYLSRIPQAVLRPGSVADVQAMLRFCQRLRIPVATRGLANTTHGQGLVGGLLVDGRSLAGVRSVEADRATAGAGTTWLELNRAAHEHGRTAPALTGYLGLTLGGTLSLGGIPPAFRTGAQVDSVLELEVVTGAGEVLRCSAEHEPELFDAVLAGLGQYGVITEATVRVVPTWQKVRGHELSYTSAESLFADVRTLTRRGEASEIYGEWWRPGERGEVHHLSTFTFFNSDAPADDTHLLRELTRPSSDAQITENDYLPHVERIDDAVEMLRAVMDWDNLVKPWFTVWLPESQAQRYVTEVLAELEPADVGDGGFVLMYVHQRSALTRPSLRLPDPDGSDWVYLFTLMTACPADAGAEYVAAMMRRNRRLFEHARGLGGVRYPIESVEFTQADWEQHYGDRWPHLVELKRRHDPAGILTPGPGVFTELADR
ncbi:FAD-binding protein [Phytoactinopolyspora limicola]|uniref:FAD-binding protein n=1 Tax=Phytoactinopolyspora limicola TaxID=2715536 RepID=UPI001408305D|nr:FAD-binding protein [Phytoactinopolyspora limicola]